MALREVHVRYRINDDSPVQVFLAKVFERFLEEAAPKVFAKAFTKKAVEELESKGDIDGLVEPILFFEEDGVIVRAAMKEGDGKDTELSPEEKITALEGLLKPGAPSTGGGSLEVAGANDLIDALTEDAEEG